MNTQQATIEIRQAHDAGARWDDFVAHCTEATFFHRWGWKEVIERAFGHRTYYLYAERDGEYQGVLPLVHMRSVLFGNYLSSLPFCVYGGALATAESVCTLLEDEATRLAQDLGVDYLELKNLRPTRADWPIKELYVTFRKRLDRDIDQNFRAIPRKQRAMVRKGMDAGLTARVTNDIDTFYRLYSESVRNLGTPVFSRRYFHILTEVFGKDCELLTVYDAERPVSVVMSFFHKQEILPYYAGSNHSARDLKANDFMYWELMKIAVNRGCEWFDYGRSKLGTGSYRFKKHWGFEPTPLAYQYRLLKSAEMPNVSPTNRKYAYFVECWKKLPLAVAGTIGPAIARHLG